MVVVMMIEFVEFGKFREDMEYVVFVGCVCYFMFDDVNID